MKLRRNERELWMIKSMGITLFWTSLPKLHLTVKFKSSKFKKVEFRWMCCLMMRSTSWKKRRCLNAVCQTLSFSRQSQIQTKRTSRIMWDLRLTEQVRSLRQSIFEKEKKSFSLSSTTLRTLQSLENLEGACQGKKRLVFESLLEWLTDSAKCTSRVSLKREKARWIGSPL